MLTGPAVPVELAAAAGDTGGGRGAVPEVTVQELGDDPLSDAIRTGTPQLIHYPRDRDDDWTRHPQLRRWIDHCALHSTLIAPVRSDGRVVAALTFGACADRPRYTCDDLGLVTELAARASIAVEHGHRFQQTRRAALALQAAMLSAPPTGDELPAGLQIEVRYLPAAAHLEVGGDWYDAFTLPGGDLAIAVGDVLGHDLAAATTMGQLRSMLRTVAVDTPDPADPGTAVAADGPAAILTRLDRIATRLRTTTYTSVVLGRLRRDPTTATIELSWSAAGHPPPLLIDPDGAVHLLERAAGMVLGIDPNTPRHDAHIQIPPGSTVLLYTDGLIERRHTDLDDGLDALTRHAAAAAALPLPAFCDALLVEADTASDDIAVLALRHRHP